MAKCVTQETFDEVVKENMTEFEMSPEEAIEEAVTQFEAQGVNLSNIVKDLSLQTTSASGDTPSIHPVIEALNNLENILKTDPMDLNSLEDNLNKVKSECDIDLPHRCLAGKNKGFLIVYDVLKKMKTDTKMLKVCISTLSALFNGQPDLVHFEGLMCFCDLLKDYQNDAEICEAVVRMIRLTCVMHESNRQAYVEQMKLIPLLASVLETHKTNPAVIKEVCFCLRVLTNDDDPRVPFGKAHEHAKMIVTEAGALKSLLEIAKDFITDKALLGELFTTLSRLAVRNEFCQEIMDLGGLAMMLNILRENMDHQGVSKQVLGVLRTIAGNDNVKVGIVNSGGVPLILEAMDKHQGLPTVCENGCAALATIALRNPGHCAAIMQCNGPVMIVQVMKIHKQVGAVQKQACMALRNLVARTREYCDPILELGAEVLINEARTQHKDCADEGKAALRDLGCKVELIERWTGTKGQVVRQ